ncbi:hypothetical protein [uncultured Limosilactobacillus sp.]|uniref:hypothetical protein n=1 Tax=uncultured Limosilactobacillus sp. TaxID=2837629 RepID=UPI0025900C20|nr:hypothetical protein [uncultured Limosilactobacillus sp.]
MNKQEIEHIDGYHQIGNTCGIYAFINAIMSDEDRGGKGTWLARKLWELAIDVKKDNIKNMVPDEVHYSLIGEFGSSENLAKFLNENKDYINELLSRLGKKHFNGAKVIEQKQIDELGVGNYLVIIRTGDEILHCICYRKNCSSKDEIINSNGKRNNCKQEKRAMKLAVNKGKIIQHFDDLKALINDAQHIRKVNLKSPKSTSSRLSKWPEVAKDNFYKIENSDECYYTYENYDDKKPPFLPIKIDIDSNDQK